MDGWMESWMGGKLDGWKVGWVEGWMGERLDGWKIG